jgi:hypothetical protein
VNHFAKAIWLAASLVVVLAGCTGTPVREEPKVANEPEKLIIHADGSMEFRNRLMATEDVVIYPDGFGGEKAAVRIRLEPFRSDFFRDTIVVERR